MKRLFMLVGVVAMGLMMMVTTAFAAAPEQIYSDVPVDSPYYESVKWATEAGLTNGTGNGKFSPDGIVTHPQLTLMLLRYYMPENAISTSHKDWEIGVLGTAEWFGLYYYKDMENMKANGVTWQSVWNVVADLADMAPYPYWYYTGDEPVMDFDRDVAHMVQMSGLCNEDPSDTVTRAEFIQFLYDVEHDNYLKPSIPVGFWDDVDVLVEHAGDSWRVRNSAMCDWTHLPEKLKQSLIDEGWKIVITYNMRDYYPKTGIMACGMTDTSKKQITLAANFNSYENEVLIHEMGHYVSLLSDFVLDTRYMFDTERFEVADLLNKSYCKTSRLEMFAEAFRYVLLNRNDEAKYAEMQERIPLCLAYIERGYLDANGVYFIGELNDVTHDYWDYITEHTIPEEEDAA